MLAAEGDRRFLFVGGKGGVGKTTTAAALAVRLAASGRRTLVVSTDPAHSLGDALGVELSGEPKPVDLTGLLGAAGVESATGCLHAMEIDPHKAVDDIRQALRLDRLRELLSQHQGGLGAGFLSALSKMGVDLEAFTSLLEFSPPGIDEAVALGRLMQLLGDSYEGEFERVVIDTAPTGHTLRLLSFPRFLHGLIGTVLSVSQKVSGFSPMGHFLGRIVGDDLQQQLEVTKSYLERLMGSMSSVNAVFEDAQMTNFVVVSIPTHLAVAESRRLLLALDQAQMPVRHVVLNQCPFIHEDGSDDDVSAAAADKLLATSRNAAGREALSLSESEARAMQLMLERHLRQRSDALRQHEVLQREAGPGVRVICAPVFYEELTGVVALDRYARLLCAA